MNTKQTIEKVRADINAALVDIATRHNLAQLKLAPRCTYDAAGAFTFKLEGVVGGGMDKDASRYVDMQQWDSTLPPLNYVLPYGGRKFSIEGCNTTGSKAKAVDLADGKRYLLPMESVRRNYVISKGAQ